MSVRTMSDVWAGSQHSGSALLMLLAIADFSDDDGKAYPAVATLARKCRIQPRAANYLLRQLQDSDELAVRIAQGPRGCNLYKINVKTLQAAAALQKTARVQSVARVQTFAGLQDIADTPAILCPTPLQPVAVNPSLNHQEPPVTSKTKFPTCPYTEIRDLYHQALPELPQAKLMGPDRKKLLATFWKWIFTEAKSDGLPRATTEAGALAWTATYFMRARDNDFLMGRTERSGSHAGWKASLDFLVSPKGRIQVIERTEVAA